MDLRNSLLIVTSCYWFFIAGCKTPAPVGGRLEFSRAISSLSEGASKREVLARLGEPDLIHRIRSRLGGRDYELLFYGCSGVRLIPTLGYVELDGSGTVTYIAGQREPSLEVLQLPESTIRELLSLIFEIGLFDAERWNPLGLVRAVNRLRTLNRDTVIAILAEYLRLNLREREMEALDFSDDAVFALLLVLFQLSEGQSHPVPALGSPAPGRVHDKWPERFPILIVEDVPVMLTFGFLPSGARQSPVSLLPFYREHGTLRRQPLSPPKNPLRLSELIAAEIENHYPDNRRPNQPVDSVKRGARLHDSPRLWRNLSRNQLVDSVKQQLLRMVSNVYVPSSRESGVEEWSRFVTGFDDLNAAWDPVKNQYRLLAE